jgi:hypothetical protein
MESVVTYKGGDPLDVCRDYVDTVNRNISMFLADKQNILTVRLEQARGDFRQFWHWIGATGNLETALTECYIRHNASR